MLGRQRRDLRSSSGGSKREGVPDDNERLGALLRDSGERAFDLPRLPDLHREERHAQPPGSLLGGLPEGHVTQDVGIPEACGAGHPGNDLLQVFHALSHNVGADNADKTSDVAARPPHAGDESDPDRITPERHDDGNRRGRLPGSHGRRVAPCDDDVDLEPDQLGGEVREPFALLVRETVRPDEVPSLDIAKLTETPPRTPS